MEAAQPAAGDALPVAAGDPAFRGPDQRAGPRDERSHWLGPVLAPGAFVPEAPPGTVQIAFTAGHRTAPPPQLAGGPRRPSGGQGRPRHARVPPGPGAATRT